MISRLMLGKLFQSGYLLQCCIHNVRITADLSVQVTLCVNTTLMHYLHKQFLFGVKESTLKQKISQFYLQIQCIKLAIKFILVSSLL